MPTPFERYISKAGIDDYDQYIYMKTQWLRLFLRIQDYDDAIKFNGRNWKRKVPIEELQNILDDIDKMMLNFEREHKFAYHAIFVKMFKK